jgi:hypothetical protein
MNKVVSLSADLMMTQGCLLCEEAKAVIAEFNQVMVEYRFQLVFYETDIADDEAAVSEYGVRIPVLRIVDTGSELDWPFTAQDLYDHLRSISASE